MQFHPIDGYLLDGAPKKPDAIAKALAKRSSDERAAPFYRALEAVGAKADDAALVALRLVLAGKAPSDEAVRRLRDLVTRVRGGDAAARDAYLHEVGAS